MDRGKNYRITHLDGGHSYCLTGYELSEMGINIRLDEVLTSQMLLFEAL